MYRIDCEVIVFCLLRLILLLFSIIIPSLYIHYIDSWFVGRERYRERESDADALEEQYQQSSHMNENLSWALKLKGLGWSAIEICVWHNGDDEMKMSSERMRDWNIWALYYVWDKNNNNNDDGDDDAHGLMDDNNNDDIDVNRVKREVRHLLLLHNTILTLPTHTHTIYECLR